MEGTVGVAAGPALAWRQLEPRVRTHWRIGALLWWTPVGAGLGAACGWLALRLEWSDASLIWLLAIIYGVVGGPLLGAILPHVMYRRWGYLLAERELRIRHGVLVNTDIWLPYARLQYVELRQGIIERRLDLASLVVHTAGSVGAQVVLPGLAPGEGEELRRTLLSLIEHEPG